MSSSRSLLLIVLVSISLHTSSSSSSVETLLQSQIVSAQCSARCSVETGLARLQCLEVCPMVVSSSSSLVCGLTHLCSTGCRTACTAGEEQQVSLSSLHLGHCLLTWTLSSTQSVVILLVGQDQGGMWHLVGTVTDSAFPRHLIARYSTVKILVIGSSGLVDTAQVTVERQLEEQEDYRETQTSPDSQHFHFNLILPLKSFLFLAVPVILAVIFIMSLTVLSCYRKSKKRKEQKPSVPFKIPDSRITLSPTCLPPSTITHNLKLNFQSDVAEDNENPYKLAKTNSFRK